MQDTLISTLENIPLPGPLAQVRRSLWRQSRRSWVIACNSPAKSLILKYHKPTFLFAVYGSRRDVNVYYSPLLKPFIPEMGITATLALGEKRGMVVGTRTPVGELGSDPEAVRRYLHWMRTAFPQVKRIALAGRLPVLAHQAGVVLDGPFVEGTLGTRFLIADVAAQMRAMPGYQRETTIAILGGAGRIGGASSQDLLRQFSRVIAFDSRYANDMETPVGQSTLLRTSNPQRLKEARLFIALLPRGEDMRPLLPYLPAGALIADDTHPGIPPALNRELSSRGVRTLKAVLQHPDFRLSPRMPSWDASQIPGCLVEALALHDAPPDQPPPENLDHFSDTARAMGFSGALVQPIAE